MVRAKGLSVVRPAPTNDPPDFFTGSKTMLLSNKVYSLLVLVPVALVADHFDVPIGLSFGLTLAAILPLAGLLGEITEQVALHTNETISGLLNATFGNATELIVAIFALRNGLLNVVKVSLLGSILSNTLLVLGCACLAGGLMRPTPTFNRVAAISNATLLQIAVLGLLVPALLQQVGQIGVMDDVDLTLSRGISLALLVLYLLYIYFQLFSHRHLFEEGDDDDEEGGEGEEDDAMLFSLTGGCVWLTVVTIFIAILSESLTNTLEGAAASWGRRGLRWLCAAADCWQRRRAFDGRRDGLQGEDGRGARRRARLFDADRALRHPGDGDHWHAHGPAARPPLWHIRDGDHVPLLAIVFFIVQNGETNWLEGAMLLFAYGIICFAFFFFKSEE